MICTTRHQHRRPSISFLQNDAVTHAHTLPISSISTSPVTLSTSVALFAIQTTLQFFFRANSDPPVSNSSELQASEGNSVQGVANSVDSDCSDTDVSSFTVSPTTEIFSPLSSTSRPLSPTTLSTPSLKSECRSSPTSSPSSSANSLPSHSSLPQTHRQQDREGRKKQTGGLPTPSPSPSPPASPLSELASKTRRILADVDEALAFQNQQEQDERGRQHQHQHLLRRRRCRSYESRFSKNHRDEGVGSTINIRSCESVLQPVRKARPSSGGQGLSLAFATFCERLLLANEAWKQERRLASVTRAVKADAAAQSGRLAFDAFCERLIRQNRVWQLEREMKALRAEGERLQRARVTAAARAGRRLAAEKRKEKMVGSLVDELVGEREALRKELVVVGRERKGCVSMKTFQQLRRDAEGMRLARRAKLAEQVVADEIEDALCQMVNRQRERIEILEKEVERYEKSTEDFSALKMVFQEGGDESDEEEVAKLLSESESDLTSSSTCVSFPVASKTPLRSAGVSSLPTPSPSPLKQPLSRTRDGGKGEKHDSLKPLVFNHHLLPPSRLRSQSVTTASSSLSTSRSAAAVGKDIASSKFPQRAVTPFSNSTSTSTTAYSSRRLCQQVETLSRAQRLSSSSAGSVPRASSGTGIGSRTSSRLSHRFCSTPGSDYPMLNSTGNTRFDLKSGNHKAPWRY